jgi:hypothetical protein
MSYNDFRAGTTVATKIPDGHSTTSVLIGQQMDEIQSRLKAKYSEAAFRGMMFNACSQAATTTTIALATAYTGLCLSNPAGSKRLLEVQAVGIALSVAPAGVCSICLGGGYIAAGVVTHTTPLAIQGSSIGSQLSVAYADAAATLVGTPRNIIPLVAGFTAANLYPHGGYFRLEGGVVIPPGGYVFVATLTVVIGFFGIIWGEYPE